MQQIVIDFVRCAQEAVECPPGRRMWTMASKTGRGPRCHEAGLASTSVAAQASISATVPAATASKAALTNAAPSKVTALEMGFEATTTPLSSVSISICNGLREWHCEERIVDLVECRKGSRTSSIETGVSFALGQSLSRRAECAGEREWNRRQASRREASNCGGCW